jgi:hypothetical protein
MTIPNKKKIELPKQPDTNREISDRDFKVALNTKDDKYCKSGARCGSNDCAICTRASAAAAIKQAQKALRKAATSLRLAWPMMPPKTPSNDFDRETVRQYRIALRELDDFVGDYGTWLDPSMGAHICIEAAAHWVDDDIAAALRQLNRKLWERLKSEGYIK